MVAVLDTTGLVVESLNPIGTPGTHGAVFPVHYTPDKPLALKVGCLRKELFQREAIAMEKMAEVDSRHLVKILSSGPIEPSNLSLPMASIPGGSGGGNCWGILMERLSGQDLFDYAEPIFTNQDRSKQEIRTSVLFQIFEQLLEAVVAVHEAGGAHMDIKPENIFIRDGDLHQSIHLTLFDVGAACFSEPCTFEDSVKSGSLQYMSPLRMIRLLQGMRGQTQRGATGDMSLRDAQLDDIWAVGATLFWATTGGYNAISNRLFQSTNFADHILTINQNADQLDTLAKQKQKWFVENYLSQQPDMRAFLGFVILRALTIDPNKRPTAKNLLQEVRDARQGKVSLEEEDSDDSSSEVESSLEEEEESSAGNHSLKKSRSSSDYNP